MSSFIVNCDNCGTEHKFDEHPHLCNDCWSGKKPLKDSLMDKYPCTLACEQQSQTGNRCICGNGDKRRQIYMRLIRQDKNATSREGE